MRPSASGSHVIRIGSTSSCRGFDQLAPPSGDWMNAIPSVQAPFAHEPGVKEAYPTPRGPACAGSAPSPGIIASSVDDVGATGTRVGAVHEIPSVEVERTMSFAAHEKRNRQSAQVT